MYNLAGGYNVLSLPIGKQAWTGIHPNKVPLFPRLPGIAVGLFLVALFTTLFISGFSKEYKSMMSDHQQATVATVKTKPGSRKSGRQFSFEYSGIFYIRVLIKHSGDAGVLFFSSIDITTSSKPGSHSINRKS